MSLAASVLNEELPPQPRSRLPIHLAMLTNFIPPYRLPVYEELGRRVEKLTILLSTPMEPNRSWKAEWGSLDVRLQRTWTLRRPWRHAAGFTDTLHVHVPVDTIAQLNKLQPDVILSAELGSRSLLSAVHASRRGKTPLVLWLTLSDHTEQGRGRLRQTLRRWLLARADAVVVNGASGARYVKRFGVHDRQVYRVPYTALSEMFDSVVDARPARAAHRLLCVGQLIERKGLAPFIRALGTWAASHPDRAVDFDIVGSGPLRAALQAIPVPANLSVRFLGDKSYRDLAAVYANAGIFAFPTLADEWGLVVNEAMSAGLPVLGSVFSQAVEELLRDGENGWSFRPNNRAEMVEAIDRALSASAEELASMRACAQASVAHLTPQFAVDQLMQALEFVHHRRGVFR